MAITIDWENKIIESTASITDLPAFHAILRDLEDDELGLLYDVTHTWKALDLGGGAFFYQLDLVNDYELKFPTPGNYEISGNLFGDIVPVAGVYVERKTSAAYITTAIGGSGPSASDIATAVRDEISTELTHLSSLQNGLIGTQATMLLELYRIMGLDPTKPLVVTQSNRSAGSEISQTITGNETITTVTRV